jgi:hypothetical protein
VTPNRKGAGAGRRIEILRVGGAEVAERHRELAASAGASRVEAALRR